MRVLVTGGAGFLGYHTVVALLGRGHEVRVLDNLDPKIHPRGTHELHSDVDFRKGDLTDRHALREALEGIDAVVHLAAYQDYLLDFSRFFLVNSVGTALLYELAVAERFPLQRVVVASSQAVYGEGCYRCSRHGAFEAATRTEANLAAGHWDVRCPWCERAVDPEWLDESNSRPHNAYGLSKRDTEEIALVLGRRHAIPTVALRYSIVQGARQSFHNAYSGALRSFTVRLLHGRPPVIFEDGQQLRDYVSVHDAVSATLLALERNDLDGEVLNVGSGRKVSVGELAALVAQVVGKRIEPVVPGLYRRGDARHLLSDISRLRARGWEPKLSQRRMVEEYVAWAAEQADLRDTYTEAEARMKALGVLRTAKA